MATEVSRFLEQSLIEAEPQMTELVFSIANTSYTGGVIRYGTIGTDFKDGIPINVYGAVIEIRQSLMNNLMPRKGQVVTINNLQYTVQEVQPKIATYLITITDKNRK
jgi:hypothetical protein